MGHSSKKDKKKHKKEKHRKNKPKKSKKKQRSSSSSSSHSDSAEEVWVEKGSNQPSTSKDCIKVQRDEWMSMDTAFGGVTRAELRKKDEKDTTNVPSVIDNLGRTDRELNPFWRDGGTGLPSEESDDDSVKISSSRVGDQGVYWLKKALQRAKEQAAEEKISLEEVVAERWGSLSKLQSLIEEAESRENDLRSNSRSNKYSNFHNRKDRDSRGRQSSYGKSYEDDKEFRSNRGDQKDSKKSFMKPPEEDSYDRVQNRYKTHNDHNKEDHLRGRQKSFKKPSEDDEDYRSSNKYKSPEGTSNLYNKEHQRGQQKSFKKPSEEDEYYDSSRKKEDFRQRGSTSSHYHSSKSSGWRKKDAEHDAKESKVKVEEPKVEENFREEEKEEETPVTMTKDEMNFLAAKMIKAEIMGDTKLAAELKEKLDRIRSASQNKVVVLTRTDSKGFERPIKGSAEFIKGKKRKVETHKDGKRVRYFADDDNLSLQEMFEKEKYTTARDQDEVFSNLAKKKIGPDDGSRDMDDVFEETARVDDSYKMKNKERNQAINEHKKKEQALDNCQWCLDSKVMSQDTVVTIGNKIYLCVPPHQSLTNGHCLIIPHNHISCGTQADEDVWEEILNLKKALVQMFLDDDDDVVFFESALYLHKHPHMIINCVPIPKEMGDVAPIYFKKAIQECETEWSNNKKLVELHGKGLRRAVPKGLEYFSVDFGLQDGYAHVIEDLKLFPNNFAQEIIGGMLDLDHSLWRKQRRDSRENQKKKALELKEKFEPYNINKK